MEIDFHLPKRKPETVPGSNFRLYGRHLGKSIRRHNSAADRPITMKFGRQMQNDVPVTTRGSKSKPNVQFQYGGRLFRTPEVVLSQDLSYDRGKRGDYQNCSVLYTLNHKKRDILFLTITLANLRGFL